MDPDLEFYPLPLPEDAVYLWDLYVIPEERNRGVGSALMSARLQHARGAGFRRAWRVVDAGSRPVLRILQRSAGGGARIAGEVALLKVGRRRWATFHALEASRPVALE